MKFANDSVGCIFAREGKFLRTTNYGNSWVELVTPVLDTKYKVIFLNELTGIACGTLKYIQKTTNAGLSWDSIKVTVGTGEDPLGVTNYNDMSFINENTGWVVAAMSFWHFPGYLTYLNVIRKTTNGGVNWVNMYVTTIAEQYRNLKFFNENSGWSHRGNSIYQTTNGGENWTIYSQNSTFSYQGLNMLNNTTGWMFGTYGTKNAISKTTNAGLNWSLQCTIDSTKGFISTFINDENNIWACGGINTIYKTTNGGGEIISAINPISNNIPYGFSLSQNYPNPFNPTTKINFDLKNSTFAMLRVYDISGREVRTLVNEKLSAGSYSYDFNATELPSGVYFYQLQTDGFVETKKMILLK
jgi:photosystem II stability/assembly factor-like uncharacterized protein